MDEILQARRSFVASCRWQRVVEGLAARGEAQHALSWKKFCWHIRWLRFVELLDEYPAERLKSCRALDQQRICTQI